MLWIHSLVGMSHFAKYRKGFRNANKSPKIPYSTTVREMQKVILNPYLGPDHHQTLTTSRGSPLAHSYHVWSTSVTAIASPADRTTDRMTERTITLLHQSWPSNHCDEMYRTNLILPGKMENCSVADPRGGAMGAIAPPQRSGKKLQVRPLL